MSCTSLHACIFLTLSYSPHRLLIIMKKYLHAQSSEMLWLFAHYGQKQWKFYCCKNAISQKSKWNQGYYVVEDVKLNQCHLRCEIEFMQYCIVKNLNGDVPMMLCHDITHLRIYGRSWQTLIWSCLVPWWKFKP